MNTYTKKIFAAALVFATAGSYYSQIKTAGSATNLQGSPGTSAFIDASSNTAINSVGNTNFGKGLVFPRTDLSAFSTFGGAPFSSSNFPNLYDGMVVYNTKEGGKAGVGTTEGFLSPGYWYYDNSNHNGDVNAGTWKKISGGITTNALSSNGNTLSSVVNGVASSAPVINEFTTAISGNQLTTSVNGITSTVNLPVAEPTTNLLTLSGSTLTSTVNGVVSNAVVLPSGGTGPSVQAGSAVNITNGNQVNLGGNQTGDVRIDNFGYKFNIVGAGNIGIGTESPSQKMDIDGAIRVRGTQELAFETNDRILAIEPNGYIKKVDIPLTVSANNGLTKSGNTIQLGGVLTKKTDIDNWGYSLNINGAGAMGIGTWNPVGNSKVNIVGGPLNIGNLTSYAGGLQVVNQDGNKAIARFYSADNTERLTIGADGNVGIGTNQPTRKMDIDGNIRIRQMVSGTLEDDDRFLAIEPNGDVKKVNIARVVNLGNFGGTINVGEGAGATEVTTLSITVPAGMKYRVLLDMKLQLNPTVKGNFFKAVNGSFILADQSSNIYSEVLGGSTFFVPASENDGVKFYAHNYKDTSVSHVYEINNANGTSATTRKLYFRYDPNDTVSPNADKRHNFNIKATFTTFEMP